MSALSDVIKATKSTLFCLDNKGIVLTRIWCLYEIWQTILVGGPSKLVVLANQLDADALKSVFIELDVAQAKATQEADRVRILEEISKSLGCHQMNLDIKKCLIDASELEAASAQKRVLALDGGDRTSLPNCKKEQDWQVITNACKPISKHISMLQMAGQTAEAGRYSKILTAMQSRLGPDGLLKKGPQVYPCSNQTVALSLEKAAQLKHDAKLDEALEEINAALSESERDTSASAWRDQVACLFSLFLLQKDMGKGREALETTQRCEALIKVAAENNVRLKASVLFATSELLLSVDCKVPEAVDACKQALIFLALTDITPPDEPLPWPAVTKVEATSKLAELILMTGDYLASAEKWQETAELWLEAGDERQYLSALSRKGGALDYGGKHKESEEVLRFVIQNRLEIGGPHVNSVVSEYLQLATVLAKTEREEEAFELHQKVGLLYQGMDSVKDTEIPLPGRGKVNMASAYLDGSMLLMTSPSAGAAIRRVLARQQGIETLNEPMIDKESQGARTCIIEEEGGEDIEDVTARAYKAWTAQEGVEAERLLRLRIPLLIKKMGNGCKEIVEAHKLLASFLSSSLDKQGEVRAAEAEVEFRAALAIHETLMNGRDPDMADQTLSQLASNVSSQGREAEGEAIYRRGLDLLISVFGEDHMRTLTLELQYRGAVFSRIASAVSSADDMNGEEFLQAQVAMNRASERLTAAAAATAS